MQSAAQLHCNPHGVAHALTVLQKEARQLREQLTGCGNHGHQEEREELLAGHLC